MGKVTPLTDVEFAESVLESSGLVLVDFWATWCQPCLRLAPILEDIAEEYIDKVKFFKIDVEQNQATAAKYSIRGIPALLLFKNGELVPNKIIGAVTKQELTDFLNENL